MKHLPKLGNDPLDTASLPPTDETELNYRTRPWTGYQECRVALLVVVVATPIVVAVSALLEYVLAAHAFWEAIFFGLSILLTVQLVWLHVIGSLHVRTSLVGIGLPIAFIVSRIWRYLPPELITLLALVSLWLAAGLIARQYCSWVLAGPLVDYERLSRWRLSVPRLFSVTLSLDCPELALVPFAAMSIGPAYWVSHRCLSEDQRIWWPISFVLLLNVVWCMVRVSSIWSAGWTGWLDTWRSTLRAFVVFTTYDPYQLKAAGVFRFPTRWLRPPLVRWALIVGTNVLLAMAVNAVCPAPRDVAQLGGSYASQALTNLLVITASVPLLLGTLTWYLFGAVLTRFDKELTRPPKNGNTIWDNYVDRIVNSNDALEQEHLLLGTTLQRDYPVLVHRNIFDQHCHVLGDSGASKTSLGLGPQITQLIAHADSTVVVVDLKGDRALFEACRLEAKRTKRMRFRWICNEIGKTSFSFNPFEQRHNDNLSAEQFAQQLLQGLSLDYGLEYGAGFFTAMNEIVLSTVLNNADVRSFRQLNCYLSNRNWYKDHGFIADWNQARHLGALVSRLAASEPINIVRKNHAYSSSVDSQAIDCLNLYDEPQVVYLWLRSPVEPTNAPTIARLFLWAMFTAANQRKGKHRVYFFIDEVQQVISEGIKLIFEQFRDLGGTIIAAHQTTGQLRRYGSDLGDTIDSCTAVKQIYRASDLNSLERLERISGSSLQKVSNWVQPYETGAGDLLERFHPAFARGGLVNVKQLERPNLSREQLLEIGAQQLSSLVRFTFNSGYTQFGGATVPIVSQYAITEEEYKRRREVPWPETKGAFRVQMASQRRQSTDEEEMESTKEKKDGNGIRSKHPSQKPDEDFIRKFDAPIQPEG